MSTRTAVRILAAASVIAAMPLLMLMVVSIFTLIFDCRAAPPGPAFCHNWAFGTQVRVGLIEVGFGFLYALPLALLGILSMAAILFAKMFKSDASRK